MEDKNTYLRNTSGGDILAYVPSIKIKKEIKTEVIETDKTDNKLYYFSKPLEGITDNMPSFVICELSNCNNDIAQFLSSLEEQLNNVPGFSEYKTAIDNGHWDEDVVKEFLESHSGNIDGNSRVEIYHTLYELQGEATEFSKMYSRLMYGNENITVEEARDIDDTRLGKMVDLEKKIEFCKINYAAVNSDIQSNKISAAYADILKSTASGLYMLSLQRPCEPITDKTGCIVNTVKNGFQDAVTKHSQDKTRDKLSGNTKMVVNSLVDVANTRNDLLNSIHARNNVEIAGVPTQYTNTINKTADMVADKASKSMVDFNKSVFLAAINKDDYISSLKEKCDLRNIFCSIK